MTGPSPCPSAGRPKTDGPGDRRSQAPVTLDRSQLDRDPARWPGGSAGQTPGTTTTDRRRTRAHLSHGHGDFQVAKLTNLTHWPNGNTSKLLCLPISDTLPGKNVQPSAPPAHPARPRPPARRTYPNRTGVRREEPIVYRGTENPSVGKPEICLELLIGFVGGKHFRRSHRGHNSDGRYIFLEGPS